MIKIRPHHLLCLCYFVNKGYSNKFTDNMRKVKELLLKEDTFTLVKGKDDICSSCPFYKFFHCLSYKKTDIYDKKIKSILKIEYNNIYSFKEVEKEVYLRIISCLKRKDICSNCSWNDLCSSLEQEVKNKQML